MRLVFSKTEPERERPEDPILEILARIWQTKLRSIDLIEEWIPRATDYEVKAGLHGQLKDERRNLRLLGDEIQRRGGRQVAHMLDQVLNKPFALVMLQPDDHARVAAFHHGIKAYTARHCERLIPFVDGSLARILYEVTQDEERHLRWADIRLSRSMKGVAGRHHTAIVDRIEDAMAAVWTKPWRRLTQGRMGGAASG